MGKVRIRRQPTHYRFDDVSEESIIDKEMRNV